VTNFSNQLMDEHYLDLI